MRGSLIVAIVAVLISASTACADELDDALARRMAGMVRDFRQPLATRVEAARTLSKLGPAASAATPDLIVVLDRLRGTEQLPLQEALVDALGQMGAAGRAALPSLAKAVHRSADLDLAIQRATALIVEASDSQEVSILIRQLQSRDASMRMRAAKALGDLGPAARSAIPGLTAVLDDTDGDARRAAVRAIGAINPGAPPTEALLRAIAMDLRSPNANFRLIAARTLARIGPAAAAALPDLEAARTDPDPDVRRAVNIAVNAVSVPPP